VHKKYGFRLLVITTLAAFITTTLKNLFRVPRPTVKPGLDPHRTYAFPSGHTFGSTVFWGYIYAVKQKIGLLILGAAIVALVALSRVYLNVHYPIDVVAGTVFGILTVILFILFEPKLTFIIKGLTFYQRILFAILIPLLILLHSIVYFNSDYTGVKTSSALLGIFFGAALENQFVRFTVKPILWIKAYRAVFGLFLSYIAYFGLSDILPFNLATCIISAFFGGFTVVFLAPLVFTTVEDLLVNKNLRPL
jgi:hypothetical protein